MICSSSLFVRVESGRGVTSHHSRSEVQCDESMHDGTRNEQSGYQLHAAKPNPSVLPLLPVAGDVLGHGLLRTALYSRRADSPAAVMVSAVSTLLSAPLGDIESVPAAGCWFPIGSCLT